jgi:hypothetical protein
MTPKQLVFEKMQMDDPELTSEEIQLLMEEDYGVSDKASDREKQVAAAKLKRASREAKAALEANKQKWATPLPDQREAQEQAQRKWESQLNSAVEKVQDIEIALNQTDKFSFKVEGEARDKVKEGYKLLSNFFKRYVKADGSEDTEAFVKDMIKLENFEQIVRSAASAQKNQGKKDVIDDIKNPDYTGKKKNDDGGSGKLSLEEQAAREFFKNN